MRKSLDALYALTAALAAVAVVSIAIIIIGQVVARWLGTQFRSADEFAGYALVAANFLALAPTYRMSEHIRVGLLVERITGRPRRVVEMAVLVLSLAAVLWATWWIGRFVSDSWRFNEMSQGLVPVPLWLPQLAMLVGLAVFAVALVEDLVRTLAGGNPSYLERQAEIEGPVFER